MSDYFSANFNSEYEKHKQSYALWYIAVDLMFLGFILIILFNYESLTAFIETMNIWVVGLISIAIIWFLTGTKFFLDSKIDSRVEKEAIKSAAALEENQTFYKWLEEYDAFYMSFYGRTPSCTETTDAWEKYSSSFLNK